ncbi:unnamed protein product [Prorocentrum cordatum]|uniref:MIF4G domain-containing protein n=1 Tax=Prorocentrum cordatum TaxID=2364126 RepID=A0ABN9U5X2_9DINO|nr:unnamed protein product [Polarella glacialis]
MGTPSPEVAYQLPPPAPPPRHKREVPGLAPSSALALSSWDSDRACARAAQKATWPAFVHGQPLHAWNERLRHRTPHSAHECTAAQDRRRLICPRTSKPARQRLMDRMPCSSSQLSSPWKAAARPERLAELQEGRGGGGARASRQQPPEDPEAASGWRDDARRAQQPSRQRDEGDGGSGDWRSEAARAQREARKQAPAAGGRDARGSAGSAAGGSWRAPPAPALESSPTSWAAKQQARKQRLSSDDATADGGAEDPAEAEVLRAMKAILNKLTIERFDVLYQQLLQWPKNVGHVEILIREVFEKATTQHHFVGMYAELCARLHQWFVETKICGDDGKIFRRVLLNRCQLSFEQTLRPCGPGPGGDLGPEAREEAELLHKTRMLGNLRLVGALLEKGMLASKVLVAVTDELLTAPTPVSLECLSVFLTCVGATFDQPSWAYRAHLEAAFRQVQDLSNSKDCPPRARFLLRDVLDLRASGWQNKKKAVRAGDGPTTLEAVHQKAEESPPGGVGEGGMLAQRWLQKRGLEAP